MTGKGSERRPQFVSDAQLEENWARTFGAPPRPVKPGVDPDLLRFAQKAVGPFGAEALARDLSETFPDADHDCFGQPANPR
jgi:hypothetical protein